jgi:hypothetical protein
MMIFKFSDFFLSSSKSTLLHINECLTDDKSMMDFITNVKYSRQRKDAKNSNEAIILKQERYSFLCPEGC